MEVGAAIASALIALLALAGGIFQWRTRELRREEVLVWANQTIDVLQSITLICVLDEDRFPEGYLEPKVCDLLFRSSILVEQGRIFFKNVIRDEFGKEKNEAYRGYRPRVLDHLVVAHQVACHWSRADPMTRKKMGIIADDCLKQFGSAMRREVGRHRTAASGTAAHGAGIHLQSMIDHVPDDTVRQGKWF